MPDKEEQRHIPNPGADEGGDEEQQKRGTGGLLSTIGDPVGKVLNTGLRPIGAPLEKVTKPLGDAVGGATKPALGPLMGNQDERMEIVGGNNKDSYEHRPEKIAGKEQTGDNPLGLDQTGRWGFRDE